MTKPLSHHKWAILYGIYLKAHRDPRRRLADGVLLLWLERRRYISRTPPGRKPSWYKRDARPSFPRHWTTFFLLKKGREALTR